MSILHTGSERIVRTLTIMSVVAVASSSSYANAQAGVENTRAPSAAANAVVQRARILADNGEAAKSRQLLDSLVKFASAESNDVAEALHWRASLSEESGPAELDWKRIVVDFPMSPRASEALLRLSELNALRNNAPVARQNILQLISDYPEAPERPRALVLLARSYFDERDPARACGALTAARKEAPLSAVEVRLQADELQQQCRGVREVALGAEPDPAATTPPGTLATQTASLPTALPTSPRNPAGAGTTTGTQRGATAPGVLAPDPAKVTADSIARAATARRDSAARATAARNDSITRATNARNDSIARVAQAKKDSTARAAIARNDSIARVATARSDSIRAVIARDSVLRDSLRKVYAARDSAAGIPSAAERARRDSAARLANRVDSLANAVRRENAGTAKAPAKGPSANGGRFSIQIAAFDTRAQANTVVKRLNANNMNARVAGTKKPFRVQVGRYATRAEATEALAALRKKGQKGFVVEVPPG